MINIGNFSATKIYVGNTEVSKAFLGDEQVYPSSTPPTPSYIDMPLTFEIISGGTIDWYCQNKEYNSKTIYYSKNGGVWTAIESGYDSINVVEGDVICLKGDNPSYGRADSAAISNFNSNNVVFNVYGNIMSLIDSTGYTSETTFTENNTFTRLFSGCTGLVDASNLILPATALTNSCYNSMFHGCTSLITAPELPATDIGEFLEAYSSMFYGCSNLNYVKCMKMTGRNSTSYWLYGVAQTGTFVTPSSSTWETGVSGIPSGWTRVNA